MWVGPHDEGGQRKYVGTAAAGCFRPTWAAIGDFIQAAEKSQMVKTLKRCLQVHPGKADLPSRLISG